MRLQRFFSCLLTGVLLVVGVLIAQDAVEVPAAPEPVTSINDLIDPEILAAATDDDGWVNYYDVYVATMTAGLTVENNGARQVVMVFGPDGWVSDDAQADWLEAMELTEDDFPAAHLQPFDEYWDDLAAMAFVNDDRFLMDGGEVQDILASAPWRDDDWPEAATWLALNDAALDLIVEGANKERVCLMWYLYDDDEVTAGLISLCPPSMVRTRIAARALALRAMNSLGAGDADAALTDVLAIHQLGEKLEGEFLIHHLLASAVDRIALTADLAMLRSGLLDEAQLELLADHLAEPMREHAIQAAMRWECRGHMDILRTMAAVIGEMEAEAYADIDWAKAQQILAEMHSRQLTAVSLEGYAERVAAWETLTEDVEAWTEDRDARAESIWLLVNQIVEGHPDPATVDAILGEELAEAIAELLIVGMWMEMKAVFLIDCESRVRRGMTAVAAGCELYRLREGEYPADLDALAEAGIMDVPADCFTGGELAYFPANDHCIIYSLGANGQDDGGLNPKTPDEDKPYLLATPDDDIPTDADDIAIVLGDVDMEDNE